MRDPRLYPTADNDHDIHEYVNVLCLTQPHAFRLLSDHSLDRNYRVVSTSDASTLMRRAEEYLYLHANAFNHPNCALHCHPALDSEISSHTVFNGVDYLADNAFYRAFDIISASVYTLNLLSHLPPLPGEAILVNLDQYLPYIFSVFHPLPREDNLSFATHPLDLIDDTDHAFDAFLAFDPSCRVSLINDMFRLLLPSARKIDSKTMIRKIFYVASHHRRSCHHICPTELDVTTYGSVCQGVCYDLSTSHVFSTLFYLRNTTPLASDVLYLHYMVSSYMR